MVKNAKKVVRVAIRKPGKGRAVEVICLIKNSAHCSSIGPNSLFLTRRLAKGFTV